MKDLRHELDDLWRAASRLPAPNGGRALMIMAARNGEGVSSVAASFALLAAARSHRSTWLIDLDLRRNGQYEAFSQGYAGRLGRPGQAFDASLNQAPFYVVTPQIAAVQGKRDPSERLLAVHRVGRSRLMVSRFRNERLRPGQKVQLRTQANYWRAARATADWVVVDAPAMERSGAGLAICSQMDGVILVISADQTRSEEIVAMKREIEDHGGRCLGVVMNQTGADARLADRFSL